MMGQKLRILFQMALASFVLCCAFAPICASAYVFDSSQAQSSPTVGQVYEQELLILRKLGLAERDTTGVLSSVDQLQKSLDQSERALVARGGRGGRGGRSGGIDTGGGTLVLTPDGPRLLDLVLHGEGQLENAAELSTVLPMTRALQYVGFDRIANSDATIVQKAIAAVQRWVPSSPVMGPKILEAVRRVPIYVFAGRFGVTGQRYFVPQHMNLPESQLRLGALYVQTFGTLVSRADLLAMPEPHQVAMIVHEALRHMQISHEAGFSTEVVQRLTALILHKPGPGDTLDQFDFMKGPILTEHLSRTRAILEVLPYSKRMCSRYPEAGAHFCGIASASARSIYKDGLLLSYVQQWERKLTKETDESRQDFYDGMNVSTRLVTLSVGAKVDRLSEDILALDRTVIGYSYIDLDLRDFNQTGDVTTDAYLRLRRLIDELVASGSIVRAN